MENAKTTVKLHFKKIRPVVGQLFHMNGRADRQTDAIRRTRLKTD